MKRNTALDFFKGIAILLVVALHAAPLWPYPAPNFILNTVMRFAVPLFFVVSGYLLFNKVKYTEDFGDRLKRYSFNVFKYYAIAMVVLLGTDYLFFKEQMGGFFDTIKLKDIIYYGVNSMDTFHLWYLIANFWAGIIVWLVCRKNLNNIKKLLLVAFIIHIVGLFIGNQPLNFGKDTFMYQREALFYGLFYLALGCYVGLKPDFLDRIFKKGSSIKLILILSLAQLLERAVFVFARFDYAKEYNPSMNYWGEYFLFTIPLTLAIVKYALDNGDKFKNNFFTKAGQRSLWIYILHVPFITVCWIVLTKIPNSEKLFPGIFLYSFLLSFGTSILIEKFSNIMKKEAFVKNKKLLYMLTALILFTGVVTKINGDNKAKEEVQYSAEEKEAIKKEFAEIVGKYTWDLPEKANFIVSSKEEDYTLYWQKDTVTPVPLKRIKPYVYEWENSDWGFVATFNPQNQTIESKDKEGIIKFTKIK